MTPQELKNSILQLAIQGKLVEQRPEEGTGAELLEKIFAVKDAKKNLTRSRGVRGGGETEVLNVANVQQLPISNTSFQLGNEERGMRKLGIGNNGNGNISTLATLKNLSALSASPRDKIPDDEKTFDIPESWEWVRLGEVLRVIGGVSYDKKDVANTGFRILRGGNIQNMKVILAEDDVFLPAQYEDEDKLVRVGDILVVASTGSKSVIGKGGYVDRPLHNTMIGAFLRICRPSSFELADYLRIIFESDFYRKHIRVLSQGTNINNVKESYITQFAIPLPPLAEQKRIVTKIEELMPLVDRYEKAWSKLEDFNKRFPVDMQKSVLQMAIQGKLVEQRAEEGAGEELYCQIQTERKRLIKCGAIKAEKPLDSISDDEKPFAIPESWAWVRFGNLGSYKKGPFGSALTKSMFVSKGANSVKVFEQKNAIQKDATLGEYYIRRDYFETKMSGFEVHPGDVIVSCAGTIGETYVLPEGIEQGIINQALMRMKIFAPMYISYFLMFFDVVLKQSARANSKGSAIKNIPPFEILKNYLVPLPPLAEQKRIVAKIEELMPLMDRYEKAMDEFDSKRR